MTVYLAISLPKIPYIHRTNMVLANPRCVFPMSHHWNDYDKVCATHKTSVHNCGPVHCCSHNPPVQCRRRPSGTPRGLGHIAHTKQACTIVGPYIAILTTHLNSIGGGQVGHHAALSSLHITPGSHNEVLSA
jgi:hypothetical protein